MGSKWIRALAFIFIYVRGVQSVDELEHSQVIDCNVEVERCLNFNQLFDNLIRENEPRVIRNLESLCEKQELFSGTDWLRILLTEFSSVLRGKKRSDGKSLFFYYNLVKPLVKHHQWKKPYDIIESMNFDEFMSQLGDVSSPEAIYFSAKFSRLLESDQTTPAILHEKVASMHSLFCDNDHIDSLSVDHNAVNQNYSCIPIENANLWIGAKNVVSRLHFDASDNLFAQIYGRKTFALLPLKYHANLDMFPFLHPLSRQSSVALEDCLDFSDGDEMASAYCGKLQIAKLNAEWKSTSFCRQLYEKIAPQRIIIATLYPGDILFLPGFYLHHVQAIDVSMSISVYSSNTAKKITNSVWESIYKDFIRTEKLRSKSLGETETLISVLLNHLIGATLHKSVQPLLIQSRYKNSLLNDPVIENLSSTLWKEQQNFDGFVCGKIGSQLKVDSELLDYWNSRVISPLLEIAEDQREVVVLDLIEDIVRNIVPVHFVPQFIESCLY